MASDTTSGARRGAIALAIALAWPCGLAAQHDQVPEPAAYALTDVTLVQADGERSEGVTIVVRGQYIEALGAGIEPPADAELLDGEELVVYPGVIDAQGEADAELPEPEIGWDTIQSWAPPRDVQGFTPSRRLVDHLTASGEGLADQRTSGVVAAAVHPEGSLMPGRGALLLFRQDAARPAELVLSPALGPTFTLQGARVYPGTLFAVIAFMRQQFEEARRQGEIATRAASSDGRLAPPVWDPDLALLRDVMEGDPRVFFHADGADDIRRVIGLADSFGFRPVIVGGEQAWRVADLLRERNVPVLVSLDFDTPRRWDPDADETEDADTAETPAESEPLDAAVLDEKQRFEEIYANAGQLEAAGVTFALTSGGGGGDILEGARKAIEYGLSEAAALRAVTAEPATLLGVPQLARIESDAPATFIVANGPLFEEDTDVAYTFVEGRLEEGSTGGPEAGDEPPAIDMTGTWEVELTVQGQGQDGTMHLTQDGAQFDGSWDAAQGSARVVDGIVSGNDVSFTLLIDAGGEQIEASLSGTAEGDDASGTGSVSFGGQNASITWTGTRTSGTPNAAAGGLR